MKIFIIEPALTVQDEEVRKDAQVFCDLIERRLKEYVCYEYVNSIKINSVKIKLDGDSCIVLFNDKNDTIHQNTGIYSLIAVGKSNNALFFPIAMSKECRKPTQIISREQSYDVYEQLRCRDLDQNYFKSIAEDFLRKIISNAAPTLYSAGGLIFMSHRRTDGEEIAARLYERITRQAQNSNIFRDIICVEASEDAQDMVDAAMAKSDVYIFLHTKESATSEWVEKELRYALLKSIPVLWVQIDDADITRLKLTPSEKPHLCYASDDFSDEKKLTEIADEILQKIFDLVVNKSSCILGRVELFKKIFKEKITQKSATDLIYEISVSRKNYHYPQRNIRQLIQLYGRTPVDSDIRKLEELIARKECAYDSAVALTDKVTMHECSGKVVKDSYDNFLYNWQSYFDGKRQEKNQEIIISGSFPDGDELYKQTLIDALVIFAREIIRGGYILTFGSHPTFQELFFSVAQDTEPRDYNRRKLKMYISKWFEGQYLEQKKEYEKYAEVFETVKQDTLNESLYIMREKMIKRDEVIALVCFGGKIKNNKDEEGVRWEIKLAQEKKIPVFIVGTAGGCSSEVAVEFKHHNWQGMNDAPGDLNELFMSSLDYNLLVNELLKHLESI